VLNEEPTYFHNVGEINTRIIELRPGAVYERYGRVILQLSNKVNQYNRKITNFLEVYNYNLKEL